MLGFGIKLIQGIWTVKPVLTEIAKSAAKAGQKGWGKGFWSSRQTATNVAKSRATSPAAQAKARDIAIQRGREAKRIKKDARQAVSAAKETARKAATPWRQNGKFVELDRTQVSKLSAPLRKQYKAAEKTWLKRTKKVGVGRQLIKAKDTPFGATGLPKVAAYSRAGMMKLGKYPTVRSGLWRVGKTAGSIYTGAQLAEMGYKRLSTGKWNVPGLIPFSETDWWSWKGGKKEGEKPTTEKAVPAEKKEAPAQPQPKAKAPPASLKEKHEIAQSIHGKHSKQAGRAWGAKHGIDISYDFPGMSSKEYQKGLDEGTISKKLGKTKEGKLTRQAKEEIEERQMRRHGGSVSANNYKLRKKSSTAKSGRVSKKSSWNY